ncbi:MAG: hypothetical protein EOP10_02940 [Proteobacteria bacterium]|nr:MAG: hypothetical protein EOP10_02940 [Pseudomonadota bacterium]
MPKVYLLVALMVLSSCRASRPSRPSFDSGPGATSRPADDDLLSGDEESGKVIDPKTGKTVDISLNIVDGRNTLRISSVEVLINKLKAVAALDEKSPGVELARKTQQSLGAYNFAQGVLPENKWTVDKMGIWFQVIDQVCRDSKLLTKIQAANGEKFFIESAYGRDMIADESAMLKDLKLTGARRARVLCTAVLTSGEFVAL